MNGECSCSDCPKCFEARDQGIACECGRPHSADWDNCPTRNHKEPEPFPRYITIGNVSVSKEELSKLSNEDKLLIAATMFEDGEEEQDYDGQILIYTGLMYGDEERSTIVSFDVPDDPKTERYAKKEEELSVEYLERELTDEEIAADPTPCADKDCNICGYLNQYDHPKEQKKQE